MLVIHHVLQNERPNRTFPNKAAIARVLLNRLLGDGRLHYVERVLRLRLVELGDSRVQAEARLLLHLKRGALVVPILNCHLLLQVPAADSQIVQSDYLLQVRLSGWPR